MVYHTFENVTFIKYQRNERSDFIAMFLISKDQYDELNCELKDENMKRNFWVYENTVEDMDGNEKTELSYFLKFRKPQLHNELEQMERLDKCMLTLEHKYYSFTPKDHDEKIEGFTTKLCAIKKQ